MSLENYPSFLLNFSECEMSNDEKHFYQFDSFRLDVAERQLTNNGVPVALTPKAFDVLVALVERGGHLVEKNELLRLVWSDSFVEEANVARIVHTLRKALGEDKNGRKFIETVSKRGYRFVAVIRGKENEFADFSNALDATIPAIAQFKDDSTIENDFVTATERTKRSSREKKSEKQFRLRVTFALGIIGLAMFLSVALFDFSDAKFNNALTFERMKQIRLTQSGDVYTPTISPDGQYLAYTKIAESKRGLLLQQMAGGRILELVPPRPNVNFWALKFSPDSNYLYYVENFENDLGVLYRISSLGGQPQKIVDFVNGGLTVAPDGMRLAFKRINKPEGVTSIIVTDNDGSNERTIAATDTNSDYWSLDWSPDGESIAYAIRHHEPKNDYWYVAEIPASGGAERRIGKSRNSKIINARWLPDKTGLIMNAVDAKTRQPQIYYLSYPDGAERRVTNDLNDYFGLSMTADGKSIVAQRSEQNRQIWVLPEADTRQARQLTFKKDQHFNLVNWLNSDALVFDADENGSYDRHNIGRLKIGEGEPQSLTAGTDNNTLPAVSPDGETIAFVSSRSGKPQVWRMAPDGTQPAQLTDLDYDVFAPQFSPDGQIVYFKASIGGEGRLMRVSVNGGEADSISDADIIFWAISPDGKNLAYSSLDRDSQKVVTKIRPLTGDRTEKILEIEPETCLQWTKDGQALDFNLAADGSKNIWRQFLTENAPRRITDFTGEKVFRFASSPDGKNIACIRYAETFDAVMLNFDE